MSKEGDRLTISTQRGDVRIEKTRDGVELDMPRDTALSPHQARQVAIALTALSRGPGEQGIASRLRDSSSSSSRDRDRS